MTSPERGFPPNSYPARSSFSPLELLLNRTTTAAALALLLSVPPVSAQTFDQMLTIHQDRTLATTNLPAGPAITSSRSPILIDDLAILPSGRVLSLDIDSTLVELKPDGVVVPIGTIEDLPGGGTQFNDFLTATSKGRLFLLRQVYPQFTRYLTELDPATGASLLKSPPPRVKTPVFSTSSTKPIGS